MDLGRYKRLKDEGIVSDRMTLSRRIAYEGFPKPLQLGGNTIAWDMEEVYAWVRSRPKRTPKAPAKTAHAEVA